MLCQTLYFLWHKVDVFLAQKCGQNFRYLSQKNAQKNDRTFAQEDILILYDKKTKGLT